ncbi:AAA family ATPase [Patescibacteria group bacterium]|nr:AAA family ATPase [Patescibacteria group bacterium]
MTQDEALDILKMGRNVYLTGPAGSGKTFLLNKYIDYLRKKNKKVGVTASTGIAATHMGGVTIHSWSGMGIKDSMTEGDLNKILKRSYLRKRFKNTEVLIIDEISMINSFQFDLLDRICQAFKKKARPFGGMQIVCSGDFFQLPPIGRSREVRFVTESGIWNNMDMNICYLEEQHRQEEGELFALLSLIRNKKVSEARQLLADNNYEREISFAVSPKLYTHNMDVDIINNSELAKVEGEKIVYYMECRGNKNIAEALKRGCLAPEELALKIGAKVMFVKNNFEAGYVNGTLGKVAGFSYDNSPIVEINDGSHIKVKPAIWTVEEDEIVKAEISQLPLRLAWAITVHKSQGMNLDSAEIDLSKCFVEGMGYVALSRLRSFAGLKLLGLNDLAFMVNQKVSELDEKLKEMSEQVAEDLKETSSLQKIEVQKQFLNSLSKTDMVKEKKKKPTSSYKITRLYISQKLPIEKIAQIQELKEETIIAHLERLVSMDKNLDLEYLKPEYFHQIKNAFAQTGDTRLSPVKDILGEEFSYREIRLARLFI